MSIRSGTARVEQREMAQSSVKIGGGTCEAPKQPAVGVHSLLVNGTQVIADNELIPHASTGQPIRRYR